MKQFWLGLFRKPQNHVLAQIFCLQFLQTLGLFVLGLNMNFSIFNKLLLKLNSSIYFQANLKKAKMKPREQIKNVKDVFLFYYFDKNVISMVQCRDSDHWWYLHPWQQAKRSQGVKGKLNFCPKNQPLKLLVLACLDFHVIICCFVTV